MKKTNLFRIIAVLMLAFLLLSALFACSPVEAGEDDRIIIDDNKNEDNIDHVTKDQAVDKVTNGLENLLEHLDSEDVSETGYYLGANAIINSDNNSAFRLVVRANMYTYPYEDKEGNIDQEALEKHNRLIKKNDMIIEWYDATKNEILIGFYYDGINANSVDKGNNLYLNLQGSKRIFPNFGDSVLYQQIVRLITKFSLDAFLGDLSGEGVTGTVGILDFFLKEAITNNYKHVINGDQTSVYFNNIDLGVGGLKDSVADSIRSFFSPFGDKLDPLTEKYLGFNFSTLGSLSFTSLASDLQFFTTPDDLTKKDIMTGVAADLRGVSRVRQGREDVSIPFTARMAFDYDTRPAGDIVIDKLGYKLYEYGQYEFVGDMYIPALNLQLDALIRTNINENDNKKNEVFSQFRDKANNDVIIGAYYKDEKTYLDVEGLQHLYGGIKLSDIGLPKAYMTGLDLSALMKEMFDLIDRQIIIMVDGLLGPQDEDSETSDMLNSIMKKVESTKKDPNIPESRNTVSITIDLELIKYFIRQNSESNAEVTTEQIVDIIESRLGIDLRSIAKIFGMSVEELLETTYVKITLDVDSNEIKIEVMSYVEDGEDALLMRLNLVPVKIGEAVKIVFPDFTNFNPLKKVMTYSGYIEGQFVFNNQEKVDFSQLLGAMMGDLSGKNTPFILPNSADLQFRMWYDQYIREQTLEDGRWVRTGRSAFQIDFYMKIADKETEIFSLYANDVGFSTVLPIEEQGFVWVDLKVLRGTEYEIPKFQIREDLFMFSMAEYMGYDLNEDVDINIGLTDILQVLLEDSTIIFSEEVISITTSNKTIKNLFKVDDMILNANIQIGFVQRVKGIDSIQKDFARYTVMGFNNISAPNPYSAKLHEKIEVKFDFSNRIISKWLFVEYDEASIEVISGKRTYMPMLKGKFMGVQRSYQVTITGGSAGTAKILSLALPDGGYVIEPLSNKLTEARANVGGGSIVTYGADFDFGFDWSEITLAGGVFEVVVTIGEGMMATYTETITIKVTNREVQTNKFVFINTENGLVKAPIAFSIMIDPYLYILEKGKYVRDGGNPENFVSHYFGLYDIEIVFGGDTEKLIRKFGTFTFDFNDSNRMWLETDINNRVAENSNEATYISIIFEGQVIAVQLNVISRTVDYIKFDGETENNIYTIDSLLEETHYIPTNPKVYFKESFNGSYFIDFADYGVTLNWTNPKADNLKLVGNDKPFLNKEGMTTSAYLDIMGNIDPEGLFMYEDYFINPLITVTLNIPDKVVEKIEHNGQLGSDIKLTNGSTVYKYENGQILEIPAENGIYFYDPFRANTAYLPSKITVRFFNEKAEEGKKYYEADYDVIYSEVKGLISIDGNGKAIIQDGTAGYYTISIQIGNDTVGKLDLSLVIYRLSSDIKGYKYLDKEKNELTGSYDESTEVRFIEVDTIKGFDLPEFKYVLTTDGFARLYNNNFATNNVWAPNTTYKITDNDTVFGGRNRQIEVRVRNSRVSEITINNSPDGLLYMVDYEKKTINLELEFVDGKIKEKTPFEFLKELMANLNVQVDFDNVSEIITKEDYQLYNYDRLFDTALWKEGQSFILILGKNKGSYDFTLNVTAKNSPEPIAGKGEISGDNIIIEELTLFDDNNQEKYPNGYVFNDNLTVSVTYSDNKTIDYGYNTPFTLEWLIEKTTSAYLTEGEYITSLSKDILTEGKDLVVSSILPNGVRVYRTITIVSIKEDFTISSVGDPLFKITNNKVLIDDIYKYYPLSTTLIRGALPTVIQIDGTVQIISNVNWNMIINLNILNNINYASEGTWDLASAFILGKEITIILEVKACIINELSYSDGSDTSKHFTATKQEGNAYLSLTFDAFERQGYAGRFSLYNNLKVGFSKTGASHLFTTLEFKGPNLDGGTSTAAELVYNYQGCRNFISDSDGVVTLTATLDDGQLIILQIKFLDKTYKNVIYSYNEKDHTNEMAVNPYDYQGLPKTVKVTFKQGKEYIYNPLWTVPNDFEIKYNTNKSFELRANLGDAFMGMQIITFILRVTPNTLTNYYLKNELNENIGNTVDDTNSTINANYLFADPFTGRVSQLPKYATDQYGEALIKYPLVWDFTDKDISAFGTVNKDLEGKYGKIITGYIKDRNVGQPVQLRVYVSSWTLENIRRPLSNGQYQIMTDINFIFSFMTNKTSYLDYQLSFRVKDPKNLNSVGEPTESAVAKIFYSEDSASLNAKDSDYRIIWDANAKKEAERVGKAYGKFRLANNDYIKYGGEVKYNYNESNCLYEFEQPYISQLDLGFGYGTNNNAMFLVDPLNPNFGGTNETPYISTAKAKGRQNMETDVELKGDISVDWRQGEGSRPPILSGNNPTINPKYIKGGIYRGYNVKVTYKVENRAYIQTFGVMLVFLDMSQTEDAKCDIIGNIIPDSYRSITVSLTTTYDDNLYNNKINPYEGEYENVKVHLNNAILPTGEGGMGMLRKYFNTEKNNFEVIYNDIVWDKVPDHSLKEFNVYSTSFRVGGNVYNNCNILKLSVTRV